MQAHNSRAHFSNLNLISVLFLLLAGIAAQNIRYYETIDYNVTDVHKQHLEAVNLPKYSVVINFRAFQRYV